jgi:hypothetical protein
VATASDVQLLTEGSGPKVATVALERDQPVDSAGASQAPETVHQQLVTAADSRGGEVVDLAPEILAELRLIRELLGVISAQLS